MGFFKVSAIKNTNIKQAYQALTQAAYKNVKRNQKAKSKESIFIDSRSQIKKEKGNNAKGCC